jgi:hypothetical protein
LPVKSVWKYLAPCVAICFLGCGGGGTTAQPSQAVLRLQSQGPLAAGEALSGIGVTISLPHGVSVKTAPDGSSAPDAVAVSGVALPGIVLRPRYVPENGAVPGSISFVVTSAALAGFGTGEFATVTCGIAPGVAPLSADFKLSSSEPADLSLQQASRISVTMSVQFR